MRGCNRARLFEELPTSQRQAPRGNTCSIALQGVPQRPLMKVSDRTPVTCRTAGHDVIFKFDFQDVVWSSVDQGSTRLFIRCSACTCVRACCQVIADVRDIQLQGRMARAGNR